MLQVEDTGTKLLKCWCECGLNVPERCARRPVDVPQRVNNRQSAGPVVGVVALSRLSSGDRCHMLPL